MADETKKLSGSEAATAVRDEKLAPQLWMMITTFFYSPSRNTHFLLGASLCAVVAATAFGQIELNAWNKELTSEEIQKLALARLLLRKPRWIVLNEHIDHIDDDTRGFVLEVFGQELADAAIINFGQMNMYGGFFTRVLHLIEDPEGQRLAPRAAASMPAPTAS